MHAQEQRRPVASMTNEELQALMDDRTTPFDIMVDAMHTLLRREAGNVTGTLVPFLDRRQLQIDSSEYLRSALAL